MFDIFSEVFFSDLLTVYELRLRYFSAFNFLENLRVLHLTRHSISRVSTHASTTRRKKQAPEIMAISTAVKSSTKFLIFDNKI